MKANEFMIGDWVELHPGHVKVTGTTDAGVHFVDSVGSGIASGADPIPLTPEILEKNGFFLTYFDNEACKVWERGDFVFGEHGELAIGIQKGWQNTRIQYVHQLQHALRLCGIEKEIEL